MSISTKRCPKYFHPLYTPNWAKLLYRFKVYFRLALAILYFRRANYFILYDKRKNDIWYPKFMYLDSIKVEKKQGMGPGFENHHEFKMFPNNRVQLSENLMVKFSCEFDFKPYPFDVHECNLAFYDREYINNILLNQVKEIGKFFQSHPHSLF